MKKGFTNPILKIALISFLPVFLVYLPFLFRLEQILFLKSNPDGMLNIYRNWDGPNYLIVAKSLYDQEKIRSLLFSPLPTTYFTAHFPLFPLLIKLFSITSPNLPMAGVIATLTTGFLLNLLFFHFIKRRTKHPFLLTLIFTLLPARLFTTRSIIAPEPLMMLLILAGFMLYEKKKYFYSSLSIAFAVMTKFQVIILTASFALVELYRFLFQKKQPRLQSLLPGILSGIFTLLLFFYYQTKTGKFLIFFEAQKVNKLQLSFPYSQFDFNQTWIGSIWLEDIIFYFLILFASAAYLYQSKKILYSFAVFIYAVFLIFIPQRDLTRFSASVMPFVFWAAAPILEKKYFRVAFIIILPAVYFYTLNFILNNQAPVTEWKYLWR